MKIEETVAYWSGITDPDSPAEQAAVVLAKEVQRLRKEASRYIEALVHYDAWFGDECGCSDDPCPVSAWNNPSPVVHASTRHETVRERRDYVLTTEQYDALYEASRPVPYMVVGGTVPSSPQENANGIWQRLGQEMGFDWKTVERGRTPQQFSAVPNPEAVQL